jgi:hypothetical protein
MVCTAKGIDVSVPMEVCLWFDLIRNWERITNLGKDAAEIRGGFHTRLTPIPSQPRQWLRRLRKSDTFVTPQPFSAIDLQCESRRPLSRRS